MPNPRRSAFAALTTALMLIAVACGSADTDADGTAGAPTTATTAESTTSSSWAPATTAPATITTATAPVDVIDDSAPSLGRLAPFVEGWNTMWSRRTIELTELKVGIPVPNPRDRIPPIDEPVFDDIAASDWLADREPGLLLELGDTARFYPIAILTRHEIVNDVVDGIPIAVTYCPLCNTGVVFDRRIDGEVHRFGVSGLLRNSDLVMWDDLTQSLWQQITGEGIVGELAGRNLTLIPSSLVRFGDFAATFPAGEVLSRDTGFRIAYGANPYTFYSSQPTPFLFSGELDDRYPALERVVGVTIGDEAVAFPFSVISEIGAVNVEIGGEPIAVLWGAPDTADALDTNVIADGQAIGTGVAYSRVVDGQILTFSAEGDDVFIDQETGSQWTLLGRAIAGPLEGAILDTVVHRNEFWFAWNAFFPEAEVYEG